MKTLLPLTTALNAAAAALAPPAGAATLTGLTNDNRIFSFDSAAPGTVSAPKTVTGLNPGDVLVGIDTRPTGAELYGYGKEGRLYRIDRGTATATEVGATSA